MSAPARTGELLRRPAADVRESTEIGRFLTWLERARGLRFDGYDDLHRWSVTDLDGFWSADLGATSASALTLPYERVLGRREMPGAEWFPGAHAELRRARPRQARGRHRGRRDRALADPAI